MDTDYVTEDDFESLVRRRRSLSGESYEFASKNVLEYLKGTGQLSEENYRELKRKHQRGR